MPKSGKIKSTAFNDIYNVRCILSLYRPELAVSNRDHLARALSRILDNFRPSAGDFASRLYSLSPSMPRFSAALVPASSVLWNSMKVLWIAGKSKRNFAAAKKEQSVAARANRQFPWDNDVVTELTNVSSAYVVFLFFSFFWIGWVQMQQSFISQARMMETHDIPNDILIILDPLTALILVPVLESIEYPALRRKGFELHHSTRFGLGLLCLSIAMARAEFIQYLIYRARSCYAHLSSRLLGW